MACRVLFSAQPDYLRIAAAAVTEAVGGAVEYLGPDVAALATEDTGLAELAALCGDVPIPFVRHLAVEDVRVGHDEAAGAAASLVAARNASSLGLQVWTSGEVPVRAEQLRASISEHLSAQGCVTQRRGSSEVMTVCATAPGVSIGITDAAAMLSDWPGGRVRLRAGPNQISRSEFKLEELAQLFPLDLRRGGRALDLGASPGGWTRILVTHGLEVVAVDPGDLDRKLARTRGVHHERMTAGRFLRTSSEHFDLVVNDMRMDASRSAQIVVDAADRLGPAGRAIVTLKVTPRGARRELDEALRLLRRRYSLTFARQLHHNRNEVTLVLERS